MDKDKAQAFAQAWLAAWNAHDLDGILAHYEDDFEMSSPAISRLTGEASGRLKGKAAVGEYWAGALEKFPDLHFELLHVLWGADSVTLIYEGVLGLSAEVFHFSPSGKVARAFAHYDL
ncbi:nuclear transport factor 2 family protein [Salinisphaera sp.]|uniref:nuclear transport factor 2 family protein n=1 Tax=Salinisphaera sp. TaxID=1914330 RepID=UPI000C51E7B9|nr:nuclear transport factor 2 family protein [Salinisphaera sp.]MBS64306.1 polyketide cyclase [Salinisphaera sp.]